jgi:hypothetical protein
MTYLLLHKCLSREVNTLPGDFHQAYAEFIQAIELRDVYASYVNAKTLLDVKEIEVAKKLPLRAVPTYDVDHSQIESGELIGRVHISLVAYVQLHGRRRTALTYKATWNVRYTLKPAGVDMFRSSDESVRGSIIAAFSQFNLPVNVWPYIRAQIHAMTQDFGVTPIRLGVLRRV